MRDLLHKILCAVENQFPSLSWEDVSSSPKELRAFLNTNILTQRKALHAICKQCHAPCEIRRLTDDTSIIYCEECEYPRIAKVNEDETWEYHIDIRQLLSLLLNNLGYEDKEIIESPANNLWLLGTHAINESPHLFLFVKNGQLADENTLSYIKHNQHLKPIVFSPVTPLSDRIASVPLHTILTQNGKSFFSKDIFRNIVGNKGFTPSAECIYLGENNAVCVEKKRILFGLNSLGEYEKSEKITGTTFNIINFLVNASRLNRNTWKSRKELSQSFHCKKDTISNKISALRGISEKIGIELIDQHRTTKKYRLNPVIIPETSSLTSSLKNRF